MNIVIITGSLRLQSNARNVVNYFKNQLIQKHHVVDTVDLAETNLPFWDEDLQGKKEKWSVLKSCQTRLIKSDALIVVTPEWNGLVPPMLKNFLLLCEARHVGHKPALLVSVAAGIGGPYPIQELMISGYRSNHICYLPEHIVVRYAGEVLISPTPDSNDSILRSKIEYQLNLLIEYAMALSQVRASGIVDFDSSIMKWC